MSRTLPWPIRKAVTFLKNPGLSLRQLEHQCYARFAEKNLDAIDIGERARRIATDAFPPRYDDIYRIRKEILTQKPKLVLEYGSGISTFVIAATLLQNRQKHGVEGKLISVEGYEDWKNHTWKHLTSDEMKIVELNVIHPRIVYRRLQINRVSEVFWYSHHKYQPVYQGIVALEYNILQNLVPDIIYLDGPDPKSVKGYGEPGGPHFPPIVLDPLIMEPRLRSGSTIIVDGRPSNCMVLKNNFKDKWICRVRGEHKCTIFKKL